MRRIGVWFMPFILWAASAQAQETATLTNPIAYIGRDRNVYVTDGTTTLPITTDAALDEYGQGIGYAQPRWSPDGTRLVYFRNTPGEGTGMMLVESGNPPQELVGAFDGVYFENRVIA